MRLHIGPLHVLFIDRETGEAATTVADIFVSQCVSLRCLGMNLVKNDEIGLHFHRIHSLESIKFKFKYTLVKTIGQSETEFKFRQIKSNFDVKTCRRADRLPRYTADSMEIIGFLSAWR
jgi:hypothetical protein